MFYQTIPYSDLSTFCASRNEVVVKAGERFIEQHGPVAHFKYLKKGLVKLHRTNQHNKEQIITFCKPLDVISIQNVFTEPTYNYSATALEDSIICVFDIQAINALMRQNADFALKMLAVSSKAINNILISALDLISKSMYGKVASLLLYFSRTVYQRNEFELPVSRKEIGQYTGLSIETVIRVLSEFRKDGLIKVYGKTISIVNEDKLMFYSEQQ
ncbi:MAG TPA: Crp/Fnr family transcriptional regulator [Bacteroidales bacterium]|nr:Crp/Fnr family transcriptional regulator [Bacteroidales bacterium]